MARVTVEDCLSKVENRFVLVMIAVKRMRQLKQGAEPFLRSKNKEAVTSLREVAAGHVTAKSRREED